MRFKTTRAMIFPAMCLRGSAPCAGGGHPVFLRLDDKASPLSFLWSFSAFMVPLSVFASPSNLSPHIYAVFLLFFLFLSNQHFQFQLYLSITQGLLLHLSLLFLCGLLLTQRVCCALRPVSGENGILEIEVPDRLQPVRYQHISLARTSPRRVIETARPNQSAGHVLP